mmetsp:Transcript_8436/g.13485  ORF Transcript_8436/g.13485 Transcript_8436/m.13485 type:complete len:361 (+) Transcript_8436:54-1136(+)
MASSLGVCHGDTDPKTWWQTLESVVAWTDYMLGTTTRRCCGGKEGRSRAWRKCAHVREVCMPRYLPTEIEELEDNRQSMLLSLTGQFTVVLFRFLTGHWGAGVIALTVFVIGNKARCSLENVTLTSFVVLGLGTGALDSLDLVHSILANGMGFFVLPLETHLLQDLTALGLMLAPVAELSGARVAWDSYLKPEFLLRGSRMRQSPYIPGMSVHAPHMAPSIGGGVWHLDDSGYHYPQHRHQSDSHSQDGTSWSTSVYKAIFGGETTNDQDVEFDDASSIGTASSYTNSVRRRTKPKRYSTASLGPLSSAEVVGGHRQDLDALCAQCGGEVDLQELRRLHGTGSYADAVYCHACWQVWLSS